MKKADKRQIKIENFDFHPGRILAKKYEVISMLGAGWEGQVFKVREITTGIDRAAKFFYPHRNPRERASNFYAKKLHKLRHCPLLIQYLTQDMIIYKGMPVRFLVSDFVEGDLLTEFLKKQPGKKLSVFEGLHLLYAIARGIEYIHQVGEYHGDLHSDNIIINRYGIGFDVKLLDMFHWGAPKRENIYDDVCDLVRLFYDALGGKKFYAKHPPEVKAIICGLKRSLILKKFKSAGQLREYLETMEWDNE
jgi:serine/threonine protein kinase